MAVGDVAVYIEATGTDTIGATATDMTWDTTVREDSGFDLQVNNIDVECVDAGLYLLLYSFATEKNPSAGATDRHTTETTIFVDGTSQGIHGRGGSYNRQNNGANESFHIGALVFETASANKNVKLQYQKTSTQTNEPSIHPNRSGLCLLQLDDETPYLKVSEAGGGQTHSTDESFSAITFDTNDKLTDESILSHNASTNTDVFTLKEVGHYLVIYSVRWANSVNRMNGLCRATLGGTEIEGSRGSAYTRVAQDANDGYSTWAGIIETSSANTELKIEGTKEGEGSGSVTSEEGSVTIVRLPDDADYLRLHRSNTVNQNLNQLINAFEWDTQDEVDAGSFSHTVSPPGSAMNIDAAGDYLFLSAYETDRSSTTNGERSVIEWVLATGATRIPFGSGARFSRGDQSTNGVFRASGCAGAILPGLTASDVIRIGYYEESQPESQPPLPAAKAVVFQADHCAVQATRCDHIAKNRFFRTTAVSVGVGAVAPQLTGSAFGTTLLPSPAAVPLVAVGPALDMPVALAPSPAAVPLVAVGPLLILGAADTVLLLPSTTVPLVAVGPALDLPIALVPSPAVVPLMVVGPTLDMPVSLAPSPAAVPLVAVGPLLDLGAGVTVLQLTPAAISLVAVAPSLLTGTNPDILLRTAHVCATLQSLGIVVMVEARNGKMVLTLATQAGVSLSKQRTAHIAKTLGFDMER